MPYSFDFDLSKISQPLFRDISRYTQKDKVHEKIGSIAKTLVQKFNIDKLTGMRVSESITIIQDLIDIETKNNLHKKQFQTTKKRALLLPHCCRKYMDQRCQARFNTETSSYQCQHCSDDCMVYQASQLAEQYNYDVYVLPGGSCVKKIFHNNHYDGIIGIACTDELKLGVQILEKHTNIAAQGIPLVKNGCSGTRFNLDMLRQVLVPTPVSV
jgi:hypothetical protein